MVDIASALEKLLADNPGPVSIAAGVSALRALGVTGPADDLQSLVGSFAAERYRSIRFDRSREPARASIQAPAD
jgi:hypothetical protein